jgi:dTDP-4-amino-4,6-dideoxygalactose transaminase
VTGLNKTISARRKQIGVGGFRVTERAKQLVMEVLDSHRLNAGPMMARFEAEIAALHGRALGLMCNSGTSALHIALGALKELHGWKDGDEVLVPAITFVATANVAIFNQLVPVFVDVEPRFYTMDPAAIEARITPRTRAILPVHVAGLPADMDPILTLARQHDLRIVEDSCEAMFTRYHGRPVGSFGEVACFSTYAAHVITTGVGGVAITDDARVLELMKSLMNHGRNPIYTRIDDDQGAEGKELFHIADSRFSFVRLGHSFRCTEMEAALGLAALEDRDAAWQRRQQIAARLTAGLADVSGRLQLPQPRPNSEHGYMMYPLVIVDPSVRRADLVQYLETRGVETRYLLPLINQPVYRAMFGNLDAAYPVAARLNETAFYVGSHPDMTDADVDYTIECLHGFLRNAG